MHGVCLRGAVTAPSGSHARHNPWTEFMKCAFFRSCRFLRAHSPIFDNNRFLLSRSQQGLSSHSTYLRSLCQSLAQSLERNLMPSPYPSRTCGQAITIPSIRHCMLLQCFAGTCRPIPLVVLRNVGNPVISDYHGRGFACDKCLSVYIWWNPWI